MIPADLPALLAQLLHLKDAIGAALPQEQQLFVSEHYPKFLTFLQSDDGKSAVRDLVDLWKLSLDQ